MAKRVFFSFHYDDVKTFRANVVRNHGLLKDTGTSGFFDASIWEDAKLHGVSSVKNLINNNLQQTSVTCVLIGSRTWSRRWVRYEIMKSFDRQNALLGVHINGVKDKNQQSFSNGLNPFEFLGLYIDLYGKATYWERTFYHGASYYQGSYGTWTKYNDLQPTLNFDRKFWGKGYTLSDWVPCYDWIKNQGYENFATWIEAAK